MIFANSFEYYVFHLELNLIEYILCVQAAQILKFSRIQTHYGFVPCDNEISLYLTYHSFRLQH